MWNLTTELVLVRFMFLPSQMKWREKWQNRMTLVRQVCELLRVQRPHPTKQKLFVLNISWRHLHLVFSEWDYRFTLSLSRVSLSDCSLAVCSNSWPLGVTVNKNNNTNIHNHTLAVSSKCYYVQYDRPGDFPVMSTTLTLALIWRSVSSSWSVLR